MNVRYGFVLILALSVSIPGALAFADVGGLDKWYSNPETYILISAFILIAGTFVVLKAANGMGDAQKRIAFWMIVAPVICSTLFLGIHTLYENMVSETGGPVHWHADYQVWLCGERIDLKDPKGFGNRIGILLMHEHDDDRIHIEGTVKDLDNIALGDYFNVIGGKLVREEIVYPSNETDGMVYSYKNGDVCPDGSVGTLKVYVNGRVIEDPENYVLSPYTLPPPGDCIIFLFDDSKSPSTERICESWEAKKWTYDTYWQKKASGEMK